MVSVQTILFISLKMKTRHFLSAKGYILLYKIKKVIAKEKFKKESNASLKYSWHHYLD